jgi:hypothetical protein
MREKYKYKFQLVNVCILLVFSRVAKLKTLIFFGRRVRFLIFSLFLYLLLSSFQYINKIKNKIKIKYEKKV